MKKILFILTMSFSVCMAEVVYVETNLDTDNDGKLDLIHASISRPSGKENLSTIFKISPYNHGGNSATFHNVNVKDLPQNRPGVNKNIGVKLDDFSLNYARIKADSIGTGKSTGCPSVGDYTEALAAKSVIDWLNGRARAFNKRGELVTAPWANGRVGMLGVSYNGTLPTMVATTGVEGLKAIVPIAAISNWYNYYRANGLVVGPGGYIGEDADTLGMYIVRRNKCDGAIQKIRREMGRATGDYTKFWQKRNYVSVAHKIKAATFIIHGQSDWNVKQKHAIDLWNSLKNVPKRMHLHAGGHRSAVSNQIQAWFDLYLYGKKSKVISGPRVEVVMNNRQTIKQNHWPHESTKRSRLYFHSDHSLSSRKGDRYSSKITDVGKKVTMSNLAKNPNKIDDKRLIYTSSPLTKNMLFSGTPKVSLGLSVLNKRSANLSIYVYEYTANGKTKLITRGWADPQNYKNMSRGELLIPGQEYHINFELEPKQYILSAGSKLAVMIASTDYHYTIRPDVGTEIEFMFGENSFIDLNLAQ